MRRVKLFQGCQTLRELENQINDWLAGNPTCKLGRTQLAQSTVDAGHLNGDREDYVVVTVLISYEVQE